MISALSTGLLVLGAALYAAAGGLFFFDVAQGGRPRKPLGSSPAVQPTEPSPTRVAPALLSAAAACHLAYVSVASFVAKVCPVGSVHFVLSVVAVVAAFVFVAARARARSLGPFENIDALGMLVAPLGLAFLLGTYFLDKPQAGPALGPAFLTLHVLVNLVGVALFLLAGAAAALYLVQERRLKQKRLARIGGLPPLDTLDRALHRFLLLGFPLLTVGIVSGTFWAQRLEIGGFDEVMRIVLGYLTWLLIGAVLLLRAAAGWRGRRAAWGTLAGLACDVAVLVVYLFRSGPSVV
jgi:ABC-type uncharacterized transport system permease subunit